MVFKKMQGDGWTEPITTMGLEGVVSSVTERMLPEINKSTEIISKRLDTTEGRHVFLNQYSMFNNQNSEPNVSDSEDVVSFNAISPSCSSPLCLSQSISNLSIHDDMGMHVPDSLKQEIMKGEFTELSELYPFE